MLTDASLALLRMERLKGRNRMRRAMELASVTQVEVSSATGLTQPYISALARGDYQRLPLETARTVASYFGCAIEDIFPVAEQAVA